MYFIETHAENADVSQTDGCLSPSNTIGSIRVPYPNAYEPIEFTVCGIVIDVRYWQL